LLAAPSASPSSSKVEKAQPGPVRLLTPTALIVGLFGGLREAVCRNLRNLRWESRIMDQAGRCAAGSNREKFMKKIVLLAACIVLAGPAFAQSVGEKTGVNSALGITPKTTDFVNEAATSDMFEIQSSQLAAQRTQDDVKSFADKMVTDHTKTTSELKGLASQQNISLPTQMTSSQQSMLDKLNGLQGNDFAKQYMDDQVSAHKDAVSLFERYGKGGDNDKLKSWATQTLPILQQHLDMAQNIYKKM
jgi:putative membrane protein